MGKKQHQKDKLYVSRSEWVSEGGGKQNAAYTMATKAILPYDHCAIALAPVNDPVCAPDGTVFDIT
jgi:peptidyl-prolyl cis-trans isomerase-like protein 2